MLNTFEMASRAENPVRESAHANGAGDDGPKHNITSLRITDDISGVMLSRDHSVPTGPSLDRIGQNRHSVPSFS